MKNRREVTTGKMVIPGAILRIAGFGLLGVTLLLVGMMASRSRQVASGQTPKATAPSEQQSPLYFEVNQGQANAEVKYLSRGNGFGLYLTPKEAVLALRSGGQARAAKRAWRGPVDRMRAAAAPSESWAGLSMRLANASEPQSVAGEAAQPGVSNYLIGRDPASWHRNVPHFAKVRYRQVYPGIDLVYYGNERELEYDFVVAPGADPARIAWTFDGASRVAVDGDGSLLLQTGAGELRQHKPVVYQDVAGARREVAGRYVVRGNGEIGFEIGAYDASCELVIDPVLIYSTYLGGSDLDEANGIQADADGNTYVAGTSYSLDFPIKNALQLSMRGVGDVFVAKYNAGGRIVYATYLGGTDEDAAFAVAADAAGNAYVVGSTYSSDFPTTNTSAQPQRRGKLDGFVSKLNPDGSALVYGTFLGGALDDVVTGLAVDASGSAYLTGQTLSSDFPVRGAYQAAMRGTTDAFVTKLSADGALFTYSSFLGGSGKDAGSGIAVDATGSIYVAGFTISPDFPTKSPAQSALAGRVDAFVTKFASSGTSLIYSTYLGGTDDDVAYGLGIDGSGNAYVTGLTSSTNFPTANAFQAAPGGGDDAFVVKVNAAGGLAVSSYLGGSGDEIGFGVAATSGGEAYFTGRTDSANFPVKDPVQSKLAVKQAATSIAPAGNIERQYGREAVRATFAPKPTIVRKVTDTVSDAYLLKLGAGGGVTYASYLGGGDIDKGFCVATDGRGNAYVAGLTASADFPTKNPAQRVLRGVTDAFVTKVADNATTQASVSAASYLGATLASDSIVSVFGPELAPQTQVSATTPLPMNLGGVQVHVRSASGTDVMAPLFFVSPTQINYLMPAGIQDGDAQIIVEANGVAISTEGARIARVAPGLFSANASGQGVAAGVVLRVKSNGAQSYEALSRFDTNLSKFVPVPIDLSNGQVYLILFGTGWRNRDSLGSVAALLGGTSSQVVYAGPQSDFSGLDQLNLLIPSSLAGRGEVGVDLSISGRAANKVVVSFK